MAKKGVLALTVDNRLTYCNAPEDKRGIGRCNHVLHQNDGETYDEFVKRSGMKNINFEGNIPDDVNPAKNNFAIEKEWNQNTLEETREILDRSGCCIINQATGTGKSSIFSAIIDDHFEEQTLFLSPAVKINTQFTDNNIESRSMILGNLKINTYQTLLKKTKDEETFKKFCKNEGIKLPIKVLCLDEIHHLKNDSYDEESNKKWKEAVERLIKYGTDENSIILGATATLKDEEAILDGRFSGNVSSNISFEEAIDRGILQMPEVISKPNTSELEKMCEETKKCITKCAPYVGYQKPKISNSTAKIKEINEEFERRANQAFKSKIEENISAGKINKVIIFSDSVDNTVRDAENYQRKFETMFPGKKIIIKHYSTTYGEHKQCFDEFCDDKLENDSDTIYVLATYGTLNEGVHAGASIIIQNRPTESFSLHDQQKGRILDMKDKTRGLIIDNTGLYCGNTFHNYKTMCESRGAQFSREGFDDIIRLDHQRAKTIKEAKIVKNAQSFFPSTKAEYLKHDLRIIGVEEQPDGTKIQSSYYIGRFTKNNFFSENCKKEVRAFIESSKIKVESGEMTQKDYEKGLFNIFSKYPEWNEYLEIIK